MCVAYRIVTMSKTALCCFPVCMHMYVVLKVFFYQQSVDRESSAQIIITQMIKHVVKECHCAYNRRYITEVQSMCDENLILVSTNMTVPFDQERSELITYLTRWIDSKPSFKPILSNVGVTTVHVSDFKTSNLVFPRPTEVEDPGTVEAPQVLGDEDESGSGEDVFESSSERTTLNIAALLLSGVAMLILSHLT